MKVFAIIPSGGTGMRMDNPIPKQYIRIGGKEIIAYTLDVFQKCDLIDEIIIPAQKNYFELLESIKVKYSFSKLTKIVEGGEERQNSVFRALKSINCNNDDLIVVHDAVRPLLPLDILVNAIDSAKTTGSAVVAIKAKDTLIKVKESSISYVDRKDVYYVQTPQIFRYKILLDAFKKAEEENFVGTDESILVHLAGYTVNIVNGSSINLKITDADDLLTFEQITR